MHSQEAVTGADSALGHYLYALDADALAAGSEQGPVPTKRQGDDLSRSRGNKLLNCCLLILKLRKFPPYQTFPARPGSA